MGPLPWIMIGTSVLGIVSGAVAEALPQGKAKCFFQVLANLGSANVAGAVRDASAALKGGK
jgi:hypothetical protein